MLSVIVTFLDQLILVAAIQHLTTIYGRSYYDALLIATELEIPVGFAAKVLGVRPPERWKHITEWN